MTSSIANLLRHLSLRTQVILLLVISSLTFLPPMAWLGYHIAATNSQDELTFRLEEELRATRSAILDPLIVRDLPILNQLAESLTGNQQELTGLEIFDDENKLLAASHIGQTSNLPLSTQVCLAGECFGKLVLYWSNEPQERYLQRVFLYSLLGCTLLLMLMTVCFYFGLHYLALNPLKEIHTALGNLASRRQHNQLQIKQCIELTALSDGVNRLKQLVDAQKDQAEYLEQQVDKRTKELIYRAEHDNLTGLFNRQTFEEHLGKLFSSNSSPTATHCILYMDLDRFKIVNDTCGHMAGDKLLKQLVEIMRRNFRSRDNLSRLGGDEFISVLHHCSVQNAQRIADSILEEVGRYRFYSEDKCFSVGVSIGIAPFCTSNNTPEYALQCADMACYLAKEEGRHRWHVFQADEQSVLENREQVCWASRLTEALHEQRFILMQQAIVAAAPKATDCRQVEVLIRLKDREGKIHPPGAFLPAAFRYNFIQKLDRYVCSHTFRFIQQHKKRLQNTIFHINLTGPTIADKEFLTFVTQELDNAEIDGKSICFEFTETIASSQVTAVKEFIDALSPRGCLFALDDFGAGTASFQQLSNIPIQIVKIDGAFIQALDDPVNYMLVEACCKIARHRNQQIVAEFVSSKEIVARLSGLPIDFYQGFLFAKPEPLSCMLTIESQNPSFEAETLSVNNQ